MRTFIFLCSLSSMLGVCCKQKPADHLIKIDGKYQHVLDTGSGKPAVIFVSGFGDRVSSWMSVQPKVAGVTRTLSYDRAGLGESQMLGKDRSLDSIVSELNQILKAENVAPPYILVGHSYGGHIIRYFANKQPDQVAGLLLVDPTVEHMEDEFRRLKTPAETKSYDSISELSRDPAWSEGVRREADYFKGNNNKMKSLRFNKSIPTTVITAMNTPEPTFKFLKGINDMKVTLHKRWSSESPHIRHVFANKSGHYVQFDEPELVINELMLLIQNDTAR
jgi:pimeloyl-ACP methyl ester carboxylesterase